jgi:hypothetical protein
MDVSDSVFYRLHEVSPFRSCLDEDHEIIPEKLSNGEDLVQGSRIVKEYSSPHPKHVY